MPDRLDRSRVRETVIVVGRFELRALFVAALAFALVLGVSPFTVTPASAAGPKVAIIVGPAGGATDAYRAEGLAAAAEARRFSTDVVTVISPDATWPAAKAAMTGASIVVYLGHGNGYPSPHADAPKPSTQNGLGLNPVAGVDDRSHQYFGEAYLARQVRLAPHAVVLLHHLCYASGNGEPGMPEPTVDLARQRVDNYAAGWIAAGAEAVVADASTTAGPAWYVRTILSGRGSIESIWRSAPSFHDHVMAFASARSPGMTGLLDPTKPRTRYYRSLVTRAELRADEVARGAKLVDRGQSSSPASAPAGPVATGVALDGLPVAGKLATLDLALAPGGPRDLGLGVRWDPLDVGTAVSWTPDPSPAPAGGASPPPVPSASSPPVPSAAVPPTASPSPSATVQDPTAAPAPAIQAEPATPEPPSPAPSPDPSPSPAVSPSPSPSPDAAVEPVALVTPEIEGSLVRLADAKPSKRGLRAQVTVPTAPGLYRLVVTLHDPQGIAFDAATQERIPALIVRVSGSASAAIAVPTSIAVVAGTGFRLPLAVTNAGELAWIEPASPDDPRLAESAGPRAALLVGQWLALDHADRSAPPEDAVASVLADPGTTAQVNLALTAPTQPGEYLLVLDVVSPLQGSLTAKGMPPVAVPVHVAAPPPPEPAVPRT